MWQYQQRLSHSSTILGIQVFLVWNLKNSCQILSLNQNKTKNSSVDWSVWNLRGQTIKKKWRSQVIILKVLENPEGLLARLKPQIHLILSPCLEPSSHSLSNLWPHRLLLLFYCWQKIKEWDRRSREKRGKELWDMCIIVWYIYLCSSFGGKMGSSFTRAQPFRLWAGHLRRVRCSFLSSKSRLGLLLLLPSCSNDSHFSSTFISFPLWLGWW